MLQRIFKGVLTAPCTTAATPSAEIHPIRGGLSGILLNTLKKARQVRSALDLSTRKLEVAYQLPLYSEQDLSDKFVQLRMLVCPWNAQKSRYRSHRRPKKFTFYIISLDGCLTSLSFMVETS